MKTIVITLLATIVTITILVSCTSVKPTTTEIVILRDITENSLAKPKAVELNGLFDLSTNPNNGIDFSFENITDVSYNPVNEAKISSQNEWFSNELEREKEIKDFNNKVIRIINNSENDTYGKRGSSIYIPLIQKLNTLSKSKADRRILIIYSDLMENTYDVSFYNKNTRKQLRMNPELIIKQLNVSQPIENLKGIEVYIVFQPIDQLRDSKFKVVSKIYKQLLEDNGATVNISANLNF